MHSEEWFSTVESNILEEGPGALAHAMKLLFPSELLRASISARSVSNNRLPTASDSSEKELNELLGAFASEPPPKKRMM